MEVLAALRVKMTKVENHLTWEVFLSHNRPSVVRFKWTENCYQKFVQSVFEERFSQSALMWHPVKLYYNYLSSTGLYCELMARHVDWLLWRCCVLCHTERPNVWECLSNLEYPSYLELRRNFIPGRTIQTNRIQSK